jgi:SH3-like domain-containing protein
MNKIIVCMLLLVAGSSLSQEVGVSPEFSENSPVEQVQDSVATIPQEEAASLAKYMQLKAPNVMVRVGPGQQYRVVYRYTKKIPLEVVDSYGPWAKVKDIKGGSGWVHSAVLDSNHLAITKLKAEERFIALRKEPKNSAKILAKLEKDRILDLGKCLDGMCEITTFDSGKEFKGFVASESLYGI